MEMSKKSWAGLIFALIVCFVIGFVNLLGFFSFTWFSAVFVVLLVGFGYAYSGREKKPWTNFAFLVIICLTILQVSPYGTSDWQFWVSLITIAASGAIFAKIKN